MSPFGNLNIRATTVDLDTRASIELQVYWKQDDEHDTAEHWLAAGTATGPAHDVDPSTRICWPASLRAAGSTSGYPPS